MVRRVQLGLTWDPSFPMPLALGKNRVQLGGLDDLSNLLRYSTLLIVFSEFEAHLDRP